MIISIVIFLGFCGYAVLEGRREAWYFHEKHDGVVTSRIPDEHRLFAAQRLFVIIVCCLIQIEFTKLFLIQAIFAFLALACVFPFFHDGEYFRERNRLNPKNYPRRWRDYSTESSAVFDFTYSDRVFLLIVGALLFASNIYLIS